MKDSNDENIRLLNLGHEPTWRKAFRKQHGIAYRAAQRLGLVKVEDIQDMAFEVLRGLPFKVGHSPLKSLEDLKARTVASVYARAFLLLENLKEPPQPKDGFSWAECFRDNPEEAEEKMALVLLSLNEIMRERLSEDERKLLLDRYVLHRSEEKMAAERGIDVETLRRMIRDALKKLQDGLRDFGLGWLLE